MKKEHEYAQLLRWIADGEVIEFDPLNSAPYVIPSKSLLQDAASQIYAPNRYRIKPKTIRIGAFDVPEPMRVAPAFDSVYWEVSIDGTSRDTWRISFAQIAALHNGLLHATQEGAEAMRNALLSLTKAPT